MKIRRIILSVAAVLLLCTAVSAAEYTDVSDTHWAYKQIDYLSAEITGYPDGSYKPEKSVSRAEFLTALPSRTSGSVWREKNGGNRPTRSAKRMTFWTILPAAALSPCRAAKLQDCLERSAMAGAA